MDYHTSSPVYAHILVHNWRRHLCYALLTVHALLGRGGFVGTRIIVSLSNSLLDTPEAHSMRGLGVRIHPVTNGYLQKWTVINEVLEKNPNIGILMQIDADCVLTERLNLPMVIDAIMPPGVNIMAHLGDRDWLPHFQNRFSLFLPAFDPRRKEGSDRLSAMMLGMTGLHLDSWLARVKTWLLGGIILIRADVIHLQGWRVMQAFAWITRCDESVLQFIRPMQRSGIFFEPIPRDLMPQNVDPPTLDFNGGAPGFAHFAGDFYREHNPEHRAYIEENLMNIFGIPLATDAPVGPAREGDYDATKDREWKPA